MRSAGRLRVVVMLLLAALPDAHLGCARGLDVRNCGRPKQQEVAVELVDGPVAIDYRKRLHSTNIIHGMLSRKRFDVVLADVRWPLGAAKVLDAARSFVCLQRSMATWVTSTPSATSRRADYAIFSEQGLALASGTDDPGAGLRQAQQLTRGTVGVTLGRDVSCGSKTRSPQATSSWRVRPLHRSA